ncbi:MAG: 4-hydroxy-3-methylbut-2-enyl diphosphate reductase [Armatimonadetes bacterium]|nr:4-hydroxy-3-methylbut-2-enyl diphosphate reductase [Armatimonadota bacterium]
MKIILAENAGFCWGVERAVDMSLKATLQNERVAMLGDLIHNKEVINRLHDLGARTVNSLEEAESGALVIRAHGISPDVRQRIQDQGLSIVNGTCPFVTRVQRAAHKLEREGRQVIMIGKEGHPEVVGVLGHIQNGIVLRTPEELESLPHYDKIGVVTQTTESRGVFEDLCRRIMERCDDVVIKDTICSATDDRQNSAKTLAPRVDLMVVIGDRHSSNTTHLAEICREYTRTHHITSAEELEKEWFVGIESVGVTAGASAPDWIIDKIMARIKDIAQELDCTSIEEVIPEKRRNSEEDHKEDFKELRHFTQSVAAAQ